MRPWDVLRTAQYLVQLVAAYNPLKLFLPLVLAAGLSSLGAAVLVLLHGSAWLTPLAVMTAATLVLAGLGAHSHVVARAAAGPILGATSAGDASERTAKR